MSFVLSATPIYGLNSFLSSVPFEYTNTARNFSQVSALSSINGVSHVLYTAFKQTKDVAINNDALVILTDQISLSTFLCNSRNVSSTNIGTSSITFFNDYVYQNDFSINIDSAIPHKNNFLLICPFKDNFKFSIIPLKSSMGTSNEYNFQKINNNLLTRSYDAVYFGNNQDNGYSNLFLQYKTDNMPLAFDNDVYSTIYLHDGLAEMPIATAGFIENGSFGGDSPINSDIILLDQFGYDNFINSGNAANNFNGLPLCLWLSANNAMNHADMLWMERWYDPNLVSQGNAFITSKNNNVYSATKDVSSSIVFQPRSKLSYLRYGPIRNTTYVDSFSANLICHFQEWSKTITDVANNIEGFSVGNYSSDDESVASMTGSFHFHVPANNILHKEANMSASVWVNQNSWKSGIDTQYFGNFSNNEGYGLFFNTNANAPLLTFPTTSGMVFGFNYRGIKVFEKSIPASTGLSASRIDYITSDLFGAKWLYDSHNKNIYKLDTDNLLTETITLPRTANISKLQINSSNHLYAMNTTNKTISCFDMYGSTLSAIAYYKAYNTFEFDKNDIIVNDMADFLMIDNNNDRIKAWGINLYKNNELFFHVGERIMAMNIDAYNNYWIIYNTNKILKLSETGKKLFEKTLPVFFTDENSIEFNFVKEIKKDVDYDVGWIVFNNNKYLIKIDSDGNIIKRINLKDVVNLKMCGNFELNVRGDFTGFESKRKFFSIDNATITSTNPTIALKINLYCGNSISIHQLNYTCSQLRGWAHIAFSHNIEGSNTILRLYVNGREVAAKTISGIKLIYYGSKISPFIIGGHSGKLGATNVEYALNTEGYFQGQLDDVRVYNNTLTPFQVRGLYMHKHSTDYTPLTWYCPTPEHTYMEEVRQFHMNRYHGSKSHKYNIKIKNLSITDETTKTIVENSVREAVKKISPIYTDLNQVIFE